MVGQTVNEPPSQMTITPQKQYLTYWPNRLRILITLFVILFSSAASMHIKKKCNKYIPLVKLLR